MGSSGHRILIEAFKKELAWVTDKWLWVISNIMLVIPVRNQRIRQF